MFLEIKGIKKSFGAGESHVDVLKGIDLEIEKGEFCVLLGPSGSGKSTLLNIIGGIDGADAGSITIQGEQLEDMNEKKLSLYRRKHLGYIFQMYNLIPNLTVRENIEVGAYLSDRPLDVDELLETLGLYEHQRKLPNQLSGGQQQRTAIGRAIVKNPDILLCDEATSALDPQTTSSILALLKDINQRFNITIVIITHQMSVVREICSHVAIVKGGEVAEQGTVEDIFTHPKTAVARELLKNDVGDDGEEKRGTAAGGKEIIKSGEKIRIVFSENSAFEPVIANLILNFNEPVNILKANTKNVGGVAKGEMILGFREDNQKIEEMKQYLIEKGLEIEEVSEHVD